MPKSKHKIDTSQLSLLDLLMVDRASGPGSFYIQTQLKNEISEGLRRCRMSRFEVAAKMSELLGYEVTKTMLDSYTAESKENYRFPAEWLAPFCVITGHYEPLKLINRLARFPIPDAEKLLDLEIERRMKELKEIEKELEDFKRLKTILMAKRR